MPKIKNIILTFDYELFLGSRSGTVENCLLIPTNKLIEVFTKYKISTAIFFVDTTYLIKLKKQDSSACRNDYKKITEQLSLLHKQGHYIYPHLHPHWLDAVYLPDINQWDLSKTDKYSFSALNTDERETLFSESIKILEEICGQQHEIGYRAGGWCIQPFNFFKEIFIAKKIAYEFSVLPGYKNDNPVQTFDFSMITNKIPYYFSEAVEKPENNGQFVEFPISTAQFNLRIKFIDRFVKKYLWQTGDRGFGDGISAQTALLKSNFADREMVSIELLTIAKLNTYKKYLKKTEYMHWISHPKMFTKHGLKMLDSFLNFATTNFNPIFDFTKMIPKPVSK